MAQHREQYRSRSQSALNAEAEAAPDIEVQGGSYFVVESGFLELDESRASIGLTLSLEMVECGS